MVIEFHNWQGNCTLEKRRKGLKEWKESQALKGGVDRCARTGEKNGMSSIRDVIKVALMWYV